MKNSSDTNGKRTRDLPACSAVPQPTALPRDPFQMVSIQEVASGQFSRFTYAFCLLKLRICSSPKLQHGLGLKCEKYEVCVCNSEIRRKVGRSTQELRSTRNP
jgi:hypothetical protein